MDKLHKNGTYAQIGGSQDGGYSGGLEVYHQARAPPYFEARSGVSRADGTPGQLRMYTYEDYYRQQDPVPPPFADSSETLRRHIGMFSPPHGARHGRRPPGLFRQ